MMVRAASWFAGPIHLSLALVGICFGCAHKQTEAIPPEVSDLETQLALVQTPIDIALTGVWQSPSGDVFFAGGGVGDETGTIGRLEEDVIISMVVPPGPMLWWVAGVDSEHVWACGDQGRILKFDGQTWVEEVTGLDEKAVLWGLWARSANDIWAVGGSIRRGGPKGILLHSQGDGHWQRVEDPVLPQVLNLYKVWGDGERIFMVGEAGLVIVGQDGIFERMQTQTDELLFTIDGQRGGPMLAVGGLESAVAIGHTDHSWVNEPTNGSPPLNGVTVNIEGQALAVGARGTVLFRDRGGHWYPIHLEARETIRDRTLHAAEWENEIWVVGGDLTALERGIVLTSKRPIPRWEFP